MVKLSRRVSIGLMVVLVVQSYAASARLEGVTYGDSEGPSGREWESPQHLAHNKEQPSATLYSFGGVESARKVLPEASD